MSKKIGFIGIGLMGLPMAKNILKSGFNLKAFNRSQNKAEPLKEFGAEITTSIDEVVKDSDVLITMLTDDTAINDVMDSPNFLENLKSVKVNLVWSPPWSENMMSEDAKLALDIF